MSPQKQLHTFLNLRFGSSLAFLSHCFLAILCTDCGPGSSVGIATDCGLDGPGIEYSLLRGVVECGCVYVRGEQAE